MSLWLIAPYPSGKLWIDAEKEQLALKIALLIKTRRNRGISNQNSPELSMMMY
jgi:hypothetical protein